MQSKATLLAVCDETNRNPSSPSSSDLITVPGFTEPSGFGMSIPVKKELQQQGADFTLWDQDLDVSFLWCKLQVQVQPCLECLLAILERPFCDQPARNSVAGQVLPKDHHCTDTHRHSWIGLPRFSNTDLDS